MASDDLLPLRGFLECPDCGRMLTGSASRGSRGVYYHYYHCGDGCKTRFKAAAVNDYFESQLVNFQLAPGIGDLFKAVVMDIFRSEHKSGNDERMNLAHQIETQEKILSAARKHFMLEEIDAEDFKAIKTECTEALRLLEGKLAEIPNKAENLKSIEGLLDIVIGRYTDIKLHYKCSSVIEKRKLISSIYPQNLCFDGVGHRTPYMNKPLTLIMQINSRLQSFKNEKRPSFDDLSRMVAPTRIELISKV
jgi:site-specific DNA recombinase